MLDLALSSIRCITLIAAIGLIITTFEFFSLHNEFKESGIFAWKVNYLIRRPAALSARLLAHLFGYYGTLTILALRLALLLATVIVLASRPYIPWTLVILVALLSMLFQYRNPMGNDGADQMLLIVFVALGLCGIVRTPVAYYSLLIFLTGQLMLSYFISGVAKLYSAEWRQGRAIQTILNTATYGTPWSYRLLQRLRFSLPACWFTIALEITFPLCLILPIKLFYLALFVGVLFHLAIAITMGLNNFIWAFLSTYPAVVFVKVRWLAQL